MTCFLRAVLALVCWAAPALAASPTELTPEQRAQFEKDRQLVQSLHPQTGDVPVPGAAATLRLGQGYYFLPAAEAKRVLTEGWGNPPDAVGEVLGMVFPKDKTFLDPDSWGAVVTFKPSGFVTDEDADTADYDRLIRDMQSGEAEENKAREKSGFPAIHLLGWAQPPVYDKTSHTLVWARELQFGGEADHTLNYDLRVLGRHGVLSLNLVSQMSRLAEIRTTADALRKTATFDPGATFADYKAGTDKAAGYGLAGLVALGVGAAAVKKAGLLAVILLFAKKGIALIVAFGAAAAAWVRRKLGRKPPPAGPVA